MNAIEHMEHKAKVNKEHYEQITAMNSKARLDLFEKQLAIDKAIKKLAKAEPLSAAMNIKTMDSVQLAENIAKERNKKALHDLKARQKRIKNKLLHATKKERLELAGDKVAIDNSFSAHRKLKAGLFKPRKSQAIGINEGLTAKH